MNEWLKAGLRTLLTPRPWKEALRHPLVLTVFLLFCLLAYAMVVGNELVSDNGKSKDYPLWHRTGRRFWSDDPLYTYRGGGLLDFLYSPFAALVFAPLAVLGKIPLYTIFVSAILAGWAWCVRQSVQMATRAKTTVAVVLLPSLIVLPLLYNNFDFGQPNLILLGLILLALRLDFKGNWIGGGLALGASAAFKLFPLAVVPYWIVRRRFRSAAVAVLSCFAFLFLAPAAFRGFDTNYQDLATWFPAITTIDEETLGQRRQGWGYKNQSLFVLTHRLTRPVDTQTGPGEQSAYMNVLDLAFKSSGRVYYGVALLIGLGFLALLLRSSWDDPWTRAREWALLAALIVIATPLARHYYFAALLVPLTILLQGIAEQPGTPLARRSLWFLGGALVLMFLSLGFLPRIFQAYGNMFWASVLIIGGLVDQFLHRPLPPNRVVTPKLP